MKVWLLVFLGGGLGSLCRFGLSSWLNALHWIPIGTLLSNLIACFLLGLIVELSLKQNNGRSFWAVGFCGGFSTFSTFSLETTALAQRGAFLKSIGYSALSVVGCLFALLAGIYLAKILKS